MDQDLESTWVYIQEESKVRRLGTTSFSCFDMSNYEDVLMPKVVFKLKVLIKR